MMNIQWKEKIMNDLIGFCTQDNWVSRLEVALRFIEAQEQSVRNVPRWMNILMIEQGCDTWEEIR